MIKWLIAHTANKHMRIKARQLRRAQVELAHYEQMQDAVAAAVEWRKALITRLTKELPK